MHIAREVGGQKLRDIAEFLRLRRAGSIPTIIAKLEFRMKKDSALARRVLDIKRKYDTCPSLETSLHKPSVRIVGVRA